MSGGTYSGVPPSSQIIGASGGNVYTDSAISNWVGYWISTLSGSVDSGGNIAGTSNFATITATTLGTDTNGAFYGYSGTRLERELVYPRFGFQLHGGTTDVCMVSGIS